MKKHYGWIVCVGCLLLHFCACGMVSVAFSVHLPYLRTEIGLSNTQVSMLNTIRSLFCTLTMTATGQYYSKLSLRQGTTIACLFLVAGYIVFSLANSAMICYLATALLGFSYGLGTMIPISILMRNWFQDRRFTALAICACGSSVSTVIVPPIVTKLIEGRGIHQTFMVEAGLITVCSVIIYLLLRDSPSELGLTPYQEDGYEEKQKKNHQPVHRCLTRWEMLLLMFAMFMVGVAGQSSSNNLTIHYMTEGYTGIQAATALSLFGLVLIAGKFIFGFTSDRFGTYRVNYVFVGSWMLANFITAMVNGTSLIFLFLSAAMNGFGATIGTIGIVVWAEDLSSAEQYTRNIRFSQALFALGPLFGNPLPGIIADVTGSYSLAYVLFGIMLMLVLLIVQLLYRKQAQSQLILAVRCKTQ